LEWKTCSVENGDGFSKLGELAGLLRYRHWDAKR
jgi:hypothetical protein